MGRRFQQLKETDQAGVLAGIGPLPLRYAPESLQYAALLPLSSRLRKYER